MTTTVAAIYENGILRLLAPLPLPENTPVEVTVDVPSNLGKEDPRQRIRAALIAAGLSRAQPEPWQGPPPLSPADRRALAERVTAGRPLSEIIDEEREER
jgi:predicted DNA-binding antitoxin AbrB/MazE fold protein